MTARPESSSCFRAKAVVLATGGIGKAWKVTSNSWEYTGDGIAMALEAGADLIDMEMTQFHPTGMIWPPSVRGLLVTEGVRGDGGTLKNNAGERFMFKYIPEFFRAETADNEDEADAWYEDKKNRRTPDLLPRDEVARAINTEVKAGRGTPHGGVFLDIASRRTADYIKRRLPSMYHQFKELADVDITKEAMEVGPTMHYIMGGVRVDPDSTQTTVPGLFAAGEVAAGLHGANRLGGNSLSDLLVFGRRAGLYAAEYAKRLPRMPMVDEEEVTRFTNEVTAPLERHAGENAYALHAELQRDDAGSGRDHPHQDRAGAGPRAARLIEGARRAHRGRGWPNVQPVLASRTRSEDDAAHLRGGHALQRCCARRAAAATRARISPSPTRRGERRTS